MIANKNFINYWKNKKVFITGHTGFKGSWMSLTLKTLGAEIYGYSLPPLKNSLFYKSNLKKIFRKNYFKDINNKKILEKSIKECSPDLIIHMAAQSLVLNSYVDPISTYKTNVIGTVNLLDSIRKIKKPTLTIIISTDKCYENNQKNFFKLNEESPLGGNDPYSSSKACLELVVRAYNKSYFEKKNIHKIVTARSGNVIGGGDYAANRLIPDFFRGIKKKYMFIRNPNSRRPWQHVHDVNCGYLKLLFYMSKFSKFHKSWNFGPDVKQCLQVKNIIKILNKNLDLKIKYYKSNYYEKKILLLNSSRSNKTLKWKNNFTTVKALEDIKSWFLKEIKNEKIIQYAILSIKKYYNIK